MPYYPVFLDLAGKKAVVVGGGLVAERKVLSLLKAGARVFVISPVVTVRLSRHAEKGSITHIKRRYRRGDLKDAFLAIAATDSKEVNSRVAGEAPRLCNVVDSAELSNFIVPSSISRGDLLIAVSTGGVSPALARAIRLELENFYGSEFGKYLSQIKSKREKAMRELSDPRERNRYLKTLGARCVLETIRKKSEGQGNNDE